MRCSYCSLSAEAKCACSLPFMCQTHLGSHLVEISNHPYETLNIDIGNERLKCLRSRILEEIQKVNNLKGDTIVKTTEIIKSIQALFKLYLAKLEEFINSYLCIFKQNKFTESDLETIIEIENIDLKVNTFDIENIKKQIKLAYTKEFLKMKEIRAQKILK